MSKNVCIWGGSLFLLLLAMWLGWQFYIYQFVHGSNWSRPRLSDSVDQIMVFEYRLLNLPDSEPKLLGTFDIKENEVFISQFISEANKSKKYEVPSKTSWEYWLQIRYENGELQSVALTRDFLGICPLASAEEEQGMMEIYKTQTNICMLIDETLLSINDQNLQ